MPTLTDDEIRAHGFAPIAEDRRILGLLAVLGGPLPSADEIAGAVTAMGDATLDTETAAIIDKVRAFHRLALDAIEDRLTAIEAIGKLVRDYCALPTASGNAKICLSYFYDALVIAAPRFVKARDRAAKNAGDVAALQKRLSSQAAKARWKKLPALLAAPGAAAAAGAADKADVLAKLPEGIEKARKHRSAVANLDLLVTHMRTVSGLVPDGGDVVAMPRAASGGRGLLTLTNPDGIVASPGTATGSAADPAAMNGDDNYWLELADPKHRSWGHQVGTFFTEWLAAKTTMSFWDWMSSTGKDAGIVGSVAYLTSDQRLRYLVGVDAGNLTYPDSAGRAQPFSTRLFRTHFSGAGFAVWVMDRHGRFFAGNHEVNVFHHSSFLGGGGSFGAGEIAVKSGKVIFVSHKTGHYRTPPRRLIDVLRVLRARGANIDDALIELRLFAPTERYRYARARNLLTAMPGDGSTLLTEAEFTRGYDAAKAARHLSDEAQKAVNQRVALDMTTDPSTLPPPAAP